MANILNHTEDGITVRDDHDHSMNAHGLLGTAKQFPGEWVQVDGSRVAVAYMNRAVQSRRPELWIEDGFTGGEEEVEFIDMTEVYRDGPVLDRIVAHLVAEENM